MPTAHTRYSYKYAELSDAAKQAAVETIAGKLGGDWWDSHNVEDVSSTIVYSLAGSFKSPGWDTYGEGDFPGITGVTLEGWSVEGGSFLAVSGTLTRDNAPGLDWLDGVEQVDLTAHRSSTTLGAEERDINFICTQCGQAAVWVADITDAKHHTITVPGGIAYDEDVDDDHEAFLLEGLPDREAQTNAMCRAVRKVLNDALTAGRKQAEWIGSAENARDYIENNDPDFNEDGTLF